MPVSQLGGFTRDQVMPQLPLTVMLYADRVVFLTLSFIGQFLYYCFLAAIMLGVGAAVVPVRAGVCEPPAQRAQAAAAAGR